VDFFYKKKSWDNIPRLLNNKFEFRSHFKMVTYSLIWILQTKLIPILPCNLDEYFSRIHIDHNGKTHNRLFFVWERRWFPFPWIYKRDRKY